MTTHSTELTVGRPRRGSIGTILESLTSLVERRRLVWYLTISEVRNKGTNSLLGNVWWFLDPALQLFVYFLLVSVIFQQAQPAILLFLGFSSFTETLEGFLPLAVADALANFSFITHFDAFTKGIIDPKDVIFFLSLMGFTLFLNVVALER